MVKHTQIIRRRLPANYLSVFDHFVELALKGLRLLFVFKIIMFISFILTKTRLFESHNNFFSLKTFSRHLQDDCKASSRLFGRQEIVRLGIEDIVTMNTSSRRHGDQQMFAGVTLPTHLSVWASSITSSLRCSLKMSSYFCSNYSYFVSLPFDDWKRFKLKL